MRKYIIIGSVAVFILAAVSVFALQGRSVQTATGNEVAPQAATNEVAPQPVTASSSGCGSGCCGSAEASGCGSATGGCGSEAVNPIKGSKRVDQITAYLMDYYTSKRGLSDVSIEVESFGCHEEATVTQAGQMVEKLSINGNRITKIES